MSKLNEKLRTIIVEDELASREVLKTTLERSFSEIELLAAVRTTREAVPLIRQHQPDLVFLDIELPNEDGFELLGYFDPVPFKVIFTTAFEEYALRALRISAVDYLLKPIDLEELNQAVKKAKKNMHPQHDRQLQQLRKNYSGLEPKLSLATQDGFIFLNIANIIRCEADGRYTFFYMSDGTKHLTSKNIGEFELSLREFNFLRVHRSQIVNLNKIKKYIKGRPTELVMEDGSQVVVSNAQRATLINLLKLL